MGLKINGSTSGSIEIDVPAVAGTNTAITIPATNGGEFIVSDSSGNIDLGALDISGSASADSVNIDASGRLLVGTTSSVTSTSKLQVAGGDISLYHAADGATAGYSLYFATDTGATARIKSGITNSDTSGAGGQLLFSTTADGASSPTTRLTIKSDGLHVEPAIYNATGAGSTVVVNSSGEVFRTSSSLKYKTDVEDLQDQYADALLNARPVWYRSTSKYDNPSWGWWGFIAEEIAEIDPRLVGWKTTEVVNHEDGSTETVELDTPIAEDVYYDRFVPHLLNLIKRQKEQIESQATQLASLEARLTALEGGAS